MSVDAVLAAGRRAARARMVEVCALTRAGEASVGADGSWQPGLPAAIWSGPCRLVAPVPVADPPAGGAVAQRTGWTVHLPAATPRPLPGDTVTVTGSPTPGLVGLRLRVTTSGAGSQQTTHRLVCEELAP